MVKFVKLTRLKTKKRNELVLQYIEKFELDKEIVKSSNYFIDVKYLKCLKTTKKVIVEDCNTYIKFIVEDKSIKITIKSFKDTDSMELKEYSVNIIEVDKNKFFSILETTSKLTHFYKKVILIGKKHNYKTLKNIKIDSINFRELTKNKKTKTSFRIMLKDILKSNRQVDNILIKEVNNNKKFEVIDQENNIIIDTFKYWDSEIFK